MLIALSRINLGAVATTEATVTSTCFVARLNHCSVFAVTQQLSEGSLSFGDCVTLPHYLFVFFVSVDIRRSHI